jgi:glucose/arabinose dehydrogenase
MALLGTPLLPQPADLDYPYLKEHNYLKKTLALLLVFTVSFPGLAQDSLSSITLPPGFSISVFADTIPRARQLTLAPDGTVFVGTSGDAVWALKDTNGDGRADEKIRLLRGRHAPNGVAFHENALYVAEINRVLKVTFPQGLTGPADVKTMYSDLPDIAHHGLKYIRVGPDGKLYLPLGMPCNVCAQQDEKFGTIRRLDLDGTTVELIARGIRNSVGFDFRPGTGELWFTDNGRDNLGDDIPPDELNRLSSIGLNFGFPYFHGRTIRDPAMGAVPPNFSYTPPVQELGPHVASLGMAFYSGTAFPEKYHTQIFIAEHGSWNRSTPIGYRVTLVELAGNKAVRYSVFADGFMRLPGRGRPVDVLVYGDGSLLVSDDSRGVVYRITYAP